MTPFTDIYEFAKVTIIDYKIDKLANTNIDGFLTYMRSLLTIGIPEFSGCLKSLDFHSETELDINNEEITVYYFDETLDIYEKKILAKIVVNEWWLTKIQDVLAFQPKLGNREFKQIANDQNLKQKSEYNNRLVEDINHSITEYQLKNLSSLPFFGGA